MKRGGGNKKVTLSVDSQVYQDFQSYCDQNAIMLSKKIELWMKDFLNKNNGKKNHKNGKKEVKK